MQFFGLSLKGHPRCIGLYTATAATHTLWAFQGNHDVTQLSSTEGTTMDQLIVMDNSSSNTCTQSQKYFLLPET